MDTSASLLERLRRPAEHHAWGRFVELYTPVLFAWTRRLGLQAHDAADLVQDVFTILVRKLPEFEYDRRRSFRAWLRTVFLNRWRNWRRDAGPVVEGDAVPEAAVPDPAAEQAEAEYNRHLVHRALGLMQAEFEPATWQACWECVVAGKPAAVVADELHLTVNAVYLAKSRVLRRLREELDGLLD